MVGKSSSSKDIHKRMLSCLMANSEYSIRNLIGENNRKRVNNCLYISIELFGSPLRATKSFAKFRQLLNIYGYFKVGLLF